MYQQCKDSFGNVSETCIKRIADNAFIPLNAPDNIDYQAFLLWKEQGNEPLPADESQA
jgi:hypothetical protein